MWKCHKCGKPVYFAERKQSLGYDWHPECLRCEECGKRLNPGQHAEHKGVPYCHVPCYGALFGPQLFGHGTRVESHKSFGVKGAQRLGSAGNVPSLPRNHMESKLKVYNQFFDNKSMEIRSREVNNRFVLEGALRIYWGVQGVIHLKEDDDQRTFIVRKRNSCRGSKATDESSSDKENDASETVEAHTLTSEVDGLSTDISLSESMTFDSCSLNEYAISDLPTTPEGASANTTGNDNSIGYNEMSESSKSTLCGSELNPSTASGNCVSTTLPSNLEKLNWDDIDDLLQVERRHDEKDKIFETMPVRLPSAMQSSSENSPTKTTADSQSDDIPSPLTSSSAKDGKSSSSGSTSSPTTTANTCSSSFDQYMTAAESCTSENITTATTTTTTINLENYESLDDTTLKPIDFEDFKRSVNQDYVNGANSFQEPSANTLKRNQPIDPSRIHDSLKLYGENSMSKSFNCEQALRSIDPNLINDTLNLKSGNGSTSHSAQRIYALQKSGSASIASGGCTNSKTPHHGRQIFEKGINRSKSGPSCFEYSDSDDDDDDSTLKPLRASATIRRSDAPQRYIQLKMDCYPDKGECESSNADAVSVTHSGSAGGDELTQSENFITRNADRRESFSNADCGDGDDQLHHISEDGVILRRPPRTGAAAIKRRSGNRRSRTKLKRRCSINGHFYNRETSFFTPPYGSQMSVWVTSLVTTQEVINLLLEKYRVDSPAENFSLFIIRDNGEQKRLKESDYPLVTRVMLGPHEDVARLFLVDARKTDEISNEVAQFLNLSLPECRAILERYDQELEREINKIKEKYAELRRRITSRMESLKVHL